jgi:hypothetical protein
MLYSQAIVAAFQNLRYVLHKGVYKLGYDENDIEQRFDIVRFEVDV